MNRQQALDAIVYDLKADLQNVKISNKFIYLHCDKYYVSW